MRFQVFACIFGQWIMYCEYATEGAAKMCVHRLKEAYYIDRYEQNRIAHAS